MLLQKQEQIMDYSISDIREQNYGIQLRKNWNHYPSDDQAIYCNKLTPGGGGGHSDPHIDFPNGCR